MSQKKKEKNDCDSGIDLLDREKEKNKVQKPSKYQVVLYNDDYTPMQLVVIILMTFFRKDVDTAWNITSAIHEKGKGIAGGPYSKEIAETKAEQVVNYARAAGYPLLAKEEKVE